MLRKFVTNLLVDILQAPVEANKSLVAQGMDSVDAENLLEALQEKGFDVEYEFLLADATLETLLAALERTARQVPVPTMPLTSDGPIGLAGPQVPWMHLHDQGWGSWANISLCLSMPTSSIPAAILPAIVQKLCDAHDSMRMVLVNSDDGQTRQQIVPKFQVPVQMYEAPALERDALRMVEAFEGEEVSPYQPSTRALVLASPTQEGRHWLCITMHHIFSDRISMHILTREIRQMIATSEMRVHEVSETGYMKYAHSFTGVDNECNHELARVSLRKHLSTADCTGSRPIPTLTDPDLRALRELGNIQSLRADESTALESLAQRFETTLPLFLHALFSVLVRRLAEDKERKTDQTDTLICHVSSNRQQESSLKSIVGCFDTSIPVAVSIADGQTLTNLCDETRRAFADASRSAPALPRGAWLEPSEIDGDETPWEALFERVPHINIVRSPAGNTIEGELDIREHPVRRAQKTRWGLLLRVALPASGRDKPTMSKDVANFVRFNAFAEDTTLASAVTYCLVELVRDLLSTSKGSLDSLQILPLVDEVVERARFASRQVREAAKLIPPSSAGEPFIYERLVARQQRWYEHNADFSLRRDSRNRFVATQSNPFPFTQLDKLEERKFVEKLGIPMPRLLHVLSKEGLKESLNSLAPSLPESFAIKPVGAAFG